MSKISHGAQARKQPFVEAISKEIAQDVAVHFNVAQELIVITEDKATLVLNQWMRRIENRRDWKTQLSLVVSLVSTIATASFNDTLGPWRGAWHTIFFIASIGSVFCLVRMVISNWRSPRIDAANIIDQLKCGAEKIAIAVPPKTPHGNQKLPTIRDGFN
ncbi:MAG: hypothetical protein M3Y07_04805 [Acidobacteriota bacterium]|nr:hypothetical protein [Acidobacteriota bacterium]